MSLEKSNKVKIYLVDDHQIVRKGLVQFLNEYSDYIICGSSDSVNTALREMNEIGPDIAIVDLSLEDSSGYELIEAIKKRFNNILILVYSMHKEMAFIERAIRTGAHGYITKSEPVENIITAIETVLQGERYFNNAIKDKLFNRLLNTIDNKSDDLVTALTNREFEVFKKLGEGFTIDEISNELKISKKTVLTYRDRIKDKLQIQKSKQLVHFAHEWLAANMK